MSERLEAAVSGASSRTVYVVSEIGINHDGNLQTALDLIDASAEAGVDAVKFQKRNLEEIYTQKLLDQPNSAEWNLDYLIPLLREVELGESDYEAIRTRTEHHGLDLIVTPFDPTSVKFCADLGVEGFKIASADLTNFDLVEQCLAYDRPMLISTGMWDDAAIEKSAQRYRDKGARFSLLLANSTYPSPYEELNLGFLTRLRQIHAAVGYSGHERGTFIPIAAIALGARVVEKHITFDRNATGPDHKASMYPNEFREMVSNIRNVQLALGSRKTVNQAETLAKEAFAKSAYALRDLAPGHVLQRSDFNFRSPGRGLFRHEVDDFIGKPLTEGVDAANCISRADFQVNPKVSEWKLPAFSKRWGVKCRFHDFDEYHAVSPPVVEFHCSDTDLDFEFAGASNSSELIIHAPEIVDRKLVDICSDDPQVVEYSLALIQRTIDKTLEVAKGFPTAPPKMVVHLGGMSLEQVTGSRTTDLMLERATDNFKRLRYNPSDVTILPENLPPRPWYLGGEWFQYGFMLPEDMVRFCDHLGLKMTFDVCHAGLYCNYSGHSLVDFAHEISPFVDHMHISDAGGINGEGLAIHEGNIDFENVLKQVSNTASSWVTEIWSGHLHNGKRTYESMHALTQFRQYL